MRHVRTALAAAVASAALGFASPATAQAPVCTSNGAYPPVFTCAAGTSLSTTVINVNGVNVQVRVVFPAGTFQPGEPVTFVVRSEPQFVGTFNADAQGGLDTTITLPNDLEVGRHSIVATGQRSGTVARTTFQVVARGGLGSTDAEAAGGSLTRTGSDSTLPLAVSGVTLVLLGGAMVLIARRSNNTSSPLAA